MKNNHEIEPQDIALDTFRSLLDLPTYRMLVSPDGRRMTIRTDCEAISDKYLVKAQTIIAQANLPLTVRSEVFQMGALVFGRSLVVEYVGAMESLPCY